jgi:putative transposase
MHHTWGLDLTGKTDCNGNTHMLLGIVEHASRANLALNALKDITS